MRIFDIGILIISVTVMSCSRSLLVDTLPASKQQLGAAWGKSILGPAVTLYPLHDGGSVMRVMMY